MSLPQRSKKRSTLMGYSTLIAATAMMAGMPGMPWLTREPTRNPSPKNTDNSPNRAKGMKPFVINGMTIYSGTRKAAIKKARLLEAIAHEPA